MFLRPSPPQLYYNSPTSCAYSKPAGSTDAELLSLPSKRAGLYAPPQGTLIARSDTNGEDLESFAGAGLYDSVPVVQLEEHALDYSNEAVYWDGGMRAGLMKSIAEAGRAVEAAFGGVPQDVEGIVDGGGGVTVVQARPQVLP